MKKVTLILLSVIFLTACTNKYKVEVDITPEEIQSEKATIAEMKKAIKNYDGEDGSIPYSEIINIALAYEKLGELGKAIDVYRYWLD